MAMCIIYLLFHMNKSLTPSPAMHIAIRPENKAGYQGKNYYGNSDSENYFLTCFHFDIPFKLHLITEHGDQGCEYMIPYSVLFHHEG